MTSTKEPKAAIPHHDLAAQHHEEAAIHHRTAAGLLSDGQPEDAAGHTLAAHGHALHAVAAGERVFQSHAKPLYQQTAPVAPEVQAAPEAPEVE